MKNQENMSISAIRSKAKKLSTRIPKTNVHIKINKDRCTGCGLCVKFCPSGSWDMDGHVAIWKYGMNLCFECGTCYHVCDADAIIWNYPPGGEGIVYKFG